MASAAQVALSVVAAATIVACAPKRPTLPRPVLAVFKLEARRIRVRRATAARLHDHLTRLLVGTELHQVVPRARLLRTLRRRRRRSERRCHKPRCQVKIGRQLLDADKALSARVTRLAPGSCEVLVYLHDLHAGAAEAAARARCECREEHFVRALNQLVCHVLGKPRRARGGGLAADTRRTVPTPKCMALGEFLWVDRHAQAFLAGRLRGDAGALAAKLLEHRRAYEAIGRYGHAGWTVAAQCRAGFLYDRFAERMVAAAQPRRVPWAIRRKGKKAVAAHREQLSRAARQRMAAFRGEARKLYRRCLARAKKRGIVNAFTGAASERLSRLSDR